ncbi:MAG: condensation domain-containing protein, partial [Jatrophihabitantaceae bacterium]
MKPISFLDFRPAPGQVTEWTVDPATAAAARSAPTDPEPLSYNQQLHLQSALVAAQTGLPGNPWIGVAFEIDGPANLDALGQAFSSWLRRHETLRGGFRWQDQQVQRFTLPAEAIALQRGPVRDFAEVEELHAHLEARFAGSIDPFAWPALVVGVISRPSRSTVFVALDHVAGDGYSLALAVWELQATYQAILQDEAPALPEIGSFREHCLAERAAGESVAADDPAVEVWREFIAACGGTAPTFPIDLGVQTGQAWPQRVHNRLLLSPEGAAAFESLVRAAGGGMFAGLLAAMAIAVQEMTGQQEFRTITPLHTRHKPELQPAMGWFITCAPVEFSLAGAANFTEVLARAKASVASAVGMAGYPALRMIELLGEDFQITRRDLFSMVSYTDYRKLPGAQRYQEWNSITIGQVTEADDSHVWMSRLFDGLHLAVRHPDTPIAAGLLDAY